MNYFQLLNINQQYQIDLNILRRQYFAYLTKYHPDNSRNIDDKQKYLIISSNLNMAYNILKDPLLRAEHLLGLNNINIQEAKPIVQFCDILEELEQIEMIGDVVKLDYMYKDKICERDILIDKLALAFNKLDLLIALDIVVSLKYLNKVIDNIILKIKYASN
jgi:molecular chaperone HscB